MTGRSEGGFTLVELLVSLTMVTVGVLAMLQGAAGVTNMLRDGRDRTRAVSIAATRLEILRQQALNSNPGCTAVTGGSTSLPGGLTEQWTVAGSGWSRDLVVAVGYPMRGRMGGHVVRTTVLCQ